MPSVLVRWMKSQNKCDTEAYFSAHQVWAYFHSGSELPLRNNTENMAALTETNDVLQSECVVLQNDCPPLAGPALRALATDASGASFATGGRRCDNRRKKTACSAFASLFSDSVNLLSRAVATPCTLASLWAERVAAAPDRATNGQSQPRCVASCRTALPLPLLHYQVLMVVLFAVRGFFLEPNVLSGEKRGITVTSARNPS